MSGIGWGIAGLHELQDFGRVHLILPQNKAEICPTIVTLPTDYGVQDILLD